jgi:hypothetical protein
MSNLVRLIAPRGTDECNFGEVAYRVHEDGHVDVPQEAVPALTTVGGFVVAPIQPAPAGEDGTGSDVQPAVETSLGDPIE